MVVEFTHLDQAGFVYCDVFLVGGACVCVLVVGAGSHLSDMSSGSPFAVGNFKHVYFHRW